MEYLKSGRKALRLIYFLIIGLAITEALSILFLRNGIFKIPEMHRWILFFVFFSFIIRFFLGAYRVLSADIELELNRHKIVIDSFFFFFQALLFFVFSLSFYMLTNTHWMIISICATDTLWLIILRIPHTEPATYKQWLWHNILMLVFIILNMLYLHSLIALLGASFIAFIYDIIRNRDFYFSLKTRSGLRIFVAGPYGDKESPNKINQNVEKAKEVGKELALKGHYPFIPHTMLHGWETDKRFTIDNFKKIDYAWLEFCDALFLIAESPGSNIEKEMAARKGLQIFTKLEDVPHKVNE